MADLLLCSFFFALHLRISLNFAQMPANTKPPRRAECRPSTRINFLPDRWYHGGYQFAETCSLFGRLAMGLLPGLVSGCASIPSQLVVAVAALRWGPEVEPTPTCRRISNSCRVKGV